MYTCLNATIYVMIMFIPLKVTDYNFNLILYVEMKTAPYNVYADA